MCTLGSPQMTERERQQREEVAAAFPSYRRANNWLQSNFTMDEKWCLYTSKRRRHWVNKHGQPDPPSKVGLHTAEGYDSHLVELQRHHLQRAAATQHYPNGSGFVCLKNLSDSTVLLCSAMRPRHRNCCYVNDTMSLFEIQRTTCRKLSADGGWSHHKDTRRPMDEKST